MTPLKRLAERAAANRRRKQAIQGDEQMMVDAFGESKVTVRKGELLAAVRENRTKHAAAYAEAVAGYREASVSKLRGMLAAAEAGETFETSTELTEPSQHLKDYDCVVRMLEMSTAEEITISQQQFQQYVMDEWSWKHQFAGTNALYGNNRKAR